MILGIVGDRNYNDYESFKEYIDKFVVNKKIDSICSGGAKGTDSLAKRYASENKINYIEYPALWSKYGKKAGPLRNREIVARSDTIIAFKSRTSIGTVNSINIAYEMKKIVVVVLINVLSD